MLQGGGSEFCSTSPALNFKKRIKNFQNIQFQSRCLCQCDMSPLFSQSLVLSQICFGADYAVTTFPAPSRLPTQSVPHTVPPISMTCQLAIKETTQNYDCQRIKFLDGFTRNKCTQTCFSRIALNQTWHWNTFTGKMIVFVKEGKEAALWEARMPQASSSSSLP